MARSRLTTKYAAGVNQTGQRKAVLTDANAIKQAKAVFAKGKDKVEFANLSKAILSGNDDVEKATNLFNLINNLPDEELKKTKRKLIESLINATNSSYHSFEQVKTNDVLQFKYYNKLKIEQDTASGKLKKPNADILVANLQRWHGLYFNIARLLTKLDILQNPEAYGTTEDGFNAMDDTAKMNFIKPLIIKYYKPKSKSDISMDSESRRNQLQEFGSRDKSVIFFFGADGEPYRSLVTIDPTESSKYPTLKEKEDNVKLTTPPFQKGGGTMLGLPTPKPQFEYNGMTVNRYGPPQLVGKTVSEIKQIVNHDAAFEAFKKKYPPADEKFKKLYRGIDLNTLK
jgi:hypothetical protein